MPLLSSACLAVLAPSVSWLDRLGGVGDLLNGTTAFLVTVIIPVIALIRRWLTKTRHALVEATSACMQRLIKTALLEQAKQLDPDEYYTLDIEFVGGHRMAVPMFYHRPMLVSENIKMAVTDHTEERTEIGLWCDGYGFLKEHRHQDQCETVYVERGTVTHIETGKIYRANESWTIKPGEWHSAYFHNCYCRIIHRPPLTSAATRPPNLSAMDLVFPPA